MKDRLSRGSLSALLLAGLMTGAGALAGPVVAASDVHFSPLPLLRLADQVFGDQAVLGAVEALTGQAQVSAGSDGRITVLMVGTDHRDGRHNGERTDTIMVMSLNTNNHAISAVSIPRDTSYVPLAPQFGGGTFTSKINGMFKWFKKNSGGDRNTALEKLRIEIAWLLGFQIDYVAYIRFDGFDALVDEAGGISVNIPAELHDPSYIDKPTWPTGAKFLATTNLLLGANAERCYGGHPKPVTNWGPVMNCHRALVYVRSRHGTVGGKSNNDYKREARQQSFIFTAMRQVRESLTTAQDIRVKANSIPTNFYTTIPIETPSDGVALFQVVQDSTVALSAVLQPPNYLGRVNNHMELKLSAVRALCAQWFAPVAH